MELTIQNICKRYNDKWAIHQVTAELDYGVYGLLGPNGAGKTTLLRMLADVLQPTSGSIQLNGQPIGAMGESYRDLLGYLPQHCGFYRQFTGRAFLMYIASLKGLDKKTAALKVGEMLELVGLRDVAKQKIESYSGGMRQRLGIAQALLNDPKVIVMDEPTVGLDPQERIRFRNILSEMSSNRIVILSTHIVSDIEYVAKDLLLIKEGRLLKQERLVSLLENVRGVVWKASVDEEQFAVLKKKYRIGNVLREAEGIEVRILAQEQPIVGAELVSPSVEDLYSYYFNEEFAV
ncbi:ABC transporter ATP-binding protein [Paenibacillus arenosi]|uniref:ABC transporter ATP-binding protein n=1 Tax=Paenibacillus arenosi TaxID=2774142 RepID=A0ABR9B3W1_9BACL|nr:ABC transporter ATP-binding protein [Paenibacillus arenosi]MBD8501061.1 ABC transporter ATP-binding protein [Paenibacillus arenosi]